LVRGAPVTAARPENPCPYPARPVRRDVQGEDRWLAGGGRAAESAIREGTSHLLPVAIVLRKPPLEWDAFAPRVGQCLQPWGNLPVPPNPLHWSASRTGAPRRVV